VHRNHDGLTVDADGFVIRRTRAPAPAGRARVGVSEPQPKPLQVADQRR
jgi:hypothetical protein